MVTTRLRAAVLAVALIASACGSSGTTTEVAAASDGAIPTVSGGQIDVSSLEGQDTVLWFWAPW